MKKYLTYRLALDLGSTSLGWAVLRLNANKEPIAIIKAGVRIFSDGRNPKDGSSLAVTRRAARSMRRRRDRLLKRKARMMDLLVNLGFFPKDKAARKALERLNPYALRAKGLDEALKPEEFARALFHINQRRGFKSNRKTDKGASDSGAMKKAIGMLQQTMSAYPVGVDKQPLPKDNKEKFDWFKWVARENPEYKDEKPRTVGEFLYQRFADTSVPSEQRRVRARNNGLKSGKLEYDLYIDRAMIQVEFEALWTRQAKCNPDLFHDAAYENLKDCLLHQRPLKPVKPGRCTLLPDEERAPLALPSQQRFRIYQEINNLRLLGEHLLEQSLTLAQRDILAAELDRKSKLSFTQICKLLKLPGSTKFNLEDAKRSELKGNTTCAILAKKEHFGDGWWQFDAARQDAIVMQLLTEENEAVLVRWLQTETGMDEARAEVLANVSLPEGYGSLSAKALARVLPELRRDVLTYDKAVQAAGFAHHSDLGFEFEHGSDEVEFVGERVIQSTGEVKPVYAFKQLPYYGRALQRHVAFPKDNPRNDEERFGKIANPTVHIGLNQVRVVVNALVKRYGRPAEVIVEVARDLKQNKEQREEAQRNQARNQQRNERLRAEAAAILQCAPERVRQADIQKLILWEELSSDIADRRCPYSGVPISARMVLSDEVEIEHILPFSKTLDDSLNNKTVALRRANRVKGNRTPWDARADFEAQGWHYDDILLRAERMPRNKCYRFAADGYEKWLRDDKDFLARALNDTRYLSRVAREYLSLICPQCTRVIPGQICPQGTRVIPGQMTAMLRGKFGLNDILGLEGEKNRNDHRHHAVDACVIAVTDQGMLQKFAQASANARERQLDRLVENMPLPWTTYREHVERAICNIWVSHKPDHGYEGSMMEETSYGIAKDGSIRQKRKADGSEGREITNLIRISAPRQPVRHGTGANGEPLPYKGYVGGSNYCIEITRNEKGKWEGNVISTFDAYTIARTAGGGQKGVDQLRHPTEGQNGRPLVMRLVINDSVRLQISQSNHQSLEETMRVVYIAVNGQIFMAPIHEANVDARNRNKEDSFSYVSKMAGSFQKARARRITISPIGELRDPGFKE